MASVDCGRKLQSSLRSRVYIGMIHRFQDPTAVANPPGAGRRVLYKVFVSIQLRCRRARKRRRGLLSGTEPRVSYDALEIGCLAGAVTRMPASQDDLIAAMDSTCA